MERDEIRAGVVYAYLLRPDHPADPFVPVKVLDAKHTYARGRLLRNGKFVGVWQRDQTWTVRMDKVHPQDSHGILAAGLPMLFWGARWQAMRADDRVTAMQSLSLEKVLADDEGDLVPVRVIDPDLLVMEWDELMEPVRRKQAEDEQRWAIESAEWARADEAENRIRERDRLALLNARKALHGLKWCLALTIVAALITPVGEEGSTRQAPIWIRVMADQSDNRSFRDFFVGGQYAIPVGILLATCIAVMLAVNSRIKRLEAKYPRR